MDNILIDLYHLKPSKSGWLKFFKKWLVKDYPGWIEDNLEAFKARTGEDWFKSKHFAGMLRDQVHVREIIDDFFDNNSISVDNLRWLQGLERYLAPHFHESPTFDRSEGQTIDVSKHQLVLSYYTVRHNIGLQPIFRAGYRGLVAMLQGEKVSIKKCPVCGKVFPPTQASGRRQKFCSAACKQKDYRKRQKQS